MACTFGPVILDHSEPPPPDLLDIMPIAGVVFLSL
jgi:hypothetical protein